MRANRPVPFLMFLILAVLAGLEEPICAAARTPAVLPLRERGPVYDRWLQNRLDTVLPELMRRETIDMWLVICREYEEDPVYLSLVPYDSLSARRLSMLVFYDRGKDGIEKFTVGRYGIGSLYQAIWDSYKIGQWERLAQGNRLQDILLAEFRAGRTGNEILAAALKKAKDGGPRFLDARQTAFHLIK